MKANILLGKNAPVRSGYINIDPFCDPNDSDCIRDNIDNLGIYIDDGELSELIALDIIDFVQMRDKEKVIDHWLSKIARGGTITIGGNDLYQCARAATFRQIPLDELNKLFYGEQIMRSGLIDANQMEKILGSRGFKTVEKKIFDFKYLVKAVRV